MRIFDANFVFKANWETDRRDQMISIPKAECQEAFDFVGETSGFYNDDNELVFVLIDSTELKVHTL